MVNHIKTTFIIAVLALSPAAAYASASAHGGPVEINWWTFHGHAPALGWLLVDFAIFLGALVFFVRKPLAEFLSTRALRVRRALDEAQEAKAAAEAKAAELDARLIDIDRELKALRDEIARAGERERAQLEADAKRMAERLTRDTEQQIESELDRAREELKREAVALAMDLAEKTLASRLSGADQNRLAARFAQSLTSVQAKEGRAP
jgi:F-type H+-transporting ATPase subunit b